MQDNETEAAPKRAAWNKGKLIGAKPPLRPKHVWSIRTKLQIADRKRDLAISRWRILRRTATPSSAQRCARKRPACRCGSR